MQRHPAQPHSAAIAVAVADLSVSSRYRSCCRRTCTRKAVRQTTIVPDAE